MNIAEPTITTYASADLATTTVFTVIVSRV